MKKEKNQNIKKQQLHIKLNSEKQRRRESYTTIIVYQKKIKFIRKKIKLSKLKNSKF